MTQGRTGISSLPAPFTCALAIALLALLPPTALAQDTGVIEGVIRDTSGEALPGASIVADYQESIGPDVDIDRLEAGESTDSEGYYSLTVPPGRYVVEVSLVGYESRQREVAVSARDTVRLDFALESDQEALDEVVVTSAAISPSENFNLMGLNYLIGGFGPPQGDQPQKGPPTDYRNQAKFRVSVRYLALDFLPGDRQPEGRQPEGGTGLYLAYEQNSFWHLYEDSSPFYDNNYKPSGFLRFSSFDFPCGGREEDFCLVEGEETEEGIPHSLAPSIELGFVHESNGRDGPVNRSWNRLTAGVQFGRPGSTPFSVSFTAWGVISRAEQNKDIVKQVGRGEVGLHVAPLAFEEGLLSGDRFGAVSTHVTSRVWGETPFRNVEANLLFHPSIGNVGKYLKPSLLLQYFYGYGENLINYNEPHSSFRIGIAIVR